MVDAISIDMNISVDFGSKLEEHKCQDYKSLICPK